MGTITYYDITGKETSRGSFADQGSAKNGISTSKKLSQPSAKKVWDAKRGKEVYLTWHIHNSSSREFSSRVPAFQIGTARGRLNGLSQAYTRTVAHYHHDFSNDLDKACSDLLPELQKLNPQYNEDELVTLAKATANSAQFDLGTFIGEMPELIRFAGNIVIELMGLLSTFRFKKVGRPTTRRVKGGVRVRNTDPFLADGLEVSSDLWLAYRYAVLPLVYTLEDAIKAIEPPEPMFVRTRVRSSEEMTTQVERTSSSMRVPLITVGACQVIARAQVYTMLSAADVKRRKVLLDLATTSWELVPYSFVVDWILQVGSFLSALQRPPCQSEGVTVSTKRSIDINVRSSTGDFYNGTSYGTSYTNYYQSAQSCHFKSREYQRSVVDFHIPVIPVGVRLNFDRVVDAFALSFQSARTKLRPYKRGRD